MKPYEITTYENTDNYGRTDRERKEGASKIQEVTASRPHSFKGGDFHAELFSHL